MTAAEASALVSDAVLKALVAAGAPGGLRPFDGSSTSVGKLKKLRLIERRMTEVKHGQWTSIVNNWHPTALGAAVLALRGAR